jgi:hypothetical protein
MQYIYCWRYSSSLSLLVRSHFMHLKPNPSNQIHIDTTYVCTSISDMTVIDHLTLIVHHGNIFLIHQSCSPIHGKNMCRNLSHSSTRAQWRLSPTHDLSTYNYLWRRSIDKQTHVICPHITFLRQQSIMHPFWRKRSILAQRQNLKSVPPPPVLLASNLELIRRRNPGNKASECAQFPGPWN